MSEFKKGQLVACRQLACAEWMLGIFDGERDDGLYVRPPLSLTCSGKRPEMFLQVKPAEEIWPEIFIGLDRGAADQAVQALDQAIYASEMESALVQRLRKQIRWLCQELNEINSGSDEMCHCPDSELRFAPKPMDCHPEGCASCWEQASLKAVKDDKDE